MFTSVNKAYSEQVLSGQLGIRMDKMQSLFSMSVNTNNRIRNGGML